MDKILFIDTLTTGMNTERCGIYRIGGIYTEDGQEKKRFDLKMCPFPGARIADQSLWVGGVDRAALARFEGQDKAFTRFLALLDSCVEVKNSRDKMYLAGFNSSAFDMPFLWEWFRRNGNERLRDYFYMQVIDIMTLGSFFLMDRRRGMHDFKLESVARSFNVYAGEGDTCDPVQNARTCLDLFRTLRTRSGLQEFGSVTEAEEFIKNY